MGWSFYCDPSQDRAYVINKLRGPGMFSEGYAMLDSRVVGNNFWSLVQRPDGTRFIALSLMQGGGRNSGWGHKDISEDMGPCELNCPLSLLNRTTDPRDGYAKDWREKVRAYHAAKASRPDYAPGQTWAFGEHAYTLQHKLEGRKGWRVSRVSDGAPFRMPFTHLARATRVEDKAA